MEVEVVFSTDSKIGKESLVMASAVVGRNAMVGEWCQLEYNCTISENSVVPD